MTWKNALDAWDFWAIETLLDSLSAVAAKWIRINLDSILSWEDCPRKKKKAWNVSLPKGQYGVGAFERCIEHVQPRCVSLAEEVYFNIT